MQSNVLEAINFWKEDYESNKEYCISIGDKGLEPALWSIIQTAMAYGYDLKDVAFMEEPEDFDLDKIEVIKASCNEKGTFIIMTGTEIDDEFIPYIEGQYGYLNIKFEDKKCYINTTLYALYQTEYNVPDWLEFLVNCFIDSYKLFPEVDEEYPRAERYVMYLCDRLQEECKRKYILENEGEEALKAYDERKAKENEPVDNKELIMKQFDNPSIDWLACDSVEEAREMLAFFYPEEYQEWLSKQPPLEENQIKFYDIVKAIKGEDENKNSKALIMAVLDKVRDTEDDLEIEQLQELNFNNVVVERISDYGNNTSVYLMFPSENDENLIALLRLLKKYDELDAANEETNYFYASALFLYPKDSNDIVIKCSMPLAWNRYGNHSSNGYSGLALTFSSNDVLGFAGDGIEVLR